MYSFSKESDALKALAREIYLDKRLKARNRASAVFVSLTLLLAVATAILFSSKANATMLLQDEFTRSNSNDPGVLWYYNEADENDVAIYRERLRLRDIAPNEGTHASYFLDASGYEALRLSFNWQVLSSTENSDELSVSLDASPTKQGEVLFETGLGRTGSYSEELALGSEYSGWIGFWLDVNSSSETVYLDNILIAGDEITSKATQQDPSASSSLRSPTPVHEANSLALLSFGLIALFFRRYRSDFRWAS